MPDFLCFTFEKKLISVQQAYWWPLVFEAMHRASFQFHDPRQVIKHGFYFSSYEELESTFQELWEALYRKNDRPLVSFWSPSSNTDLFSCEVSVNEKASDYWQIDMTLESNHLLSGNVKYRFFTFLQAALALYELCVPCSIDLYWDEEFASQHLIRVQSVASQEPIEPLFFCGTRLDWQKIACIQEHCIFIPKSIPIYAGPREGFRFLELSQ